jgi:DNA-directed RNA polymerase specialized sigma24 family protein
MLSTTGRPTGPARGSRSSARSRTRSGGTRTGGRAGVTAVGLDPAAGSPHPAYRARVASTLERSTERQRLVLALLLVERMSAAEAADALGITVPRLERAYRDVLGGLRRVGRGGGSQTGVGGRSRRAPAAASLRRAA